MIKIYVKDEDFLELLSKQVERWADDDVVNLYKNFYRGLIDDGCFYDVEIDIAKMVENDYVINYNVIRKKDFTEEEYKQLENAWKEDEDSVEVTLEDGREFCLLAHLDDMFLVER